jgi:hypothetical protein
MNIIKNLNIQLLKTFSNFLGFLSQGRLLSNDGRREMRNFYPAKMTNFQRFDFTVSTFNYPPMVRYRG